MSVQDDAVAQRSLMQHRLSLRTRSGRAVVRALAGIAGADLSAAQIGKSASVRSGLVAEHAERLVALGLARPGKLNARGNRTWRLSVAGYEYARERGLT